ncbi:endonuclease/exonuclease/phosphatase family protein [Neokomagataea tanensis]|uniref:Endonuclease/exonuclease/phosphatase family protein n=1 Tax=Neokomagataea tanensis TaxID=661191 RepID=A0A4Y6V8V8_9PROT|nr:MULTISPECIES: endonuclease/exonuclease/phosphatase family protein [Neokomagataea]QDH24805.1 endonuclease/exonuclease/phosphatase family protein [Neokomagataea tanensis]
MCHSPSAQAHTLKISTWNLDWLTSRQTGDSALPEDVQGRTENDFQRLRKYAQHLNADILAVQEVDDLPALKRVLNTNDYQLFLSTDDVVQKTGLAVRKSLAVTVNEPLQELDINPQAVHHLRTGLDVTLSDGKTTLRLLVVHLKTGCWDQPLTQKQHSCPTLYKQFTLLENWIAERQDEGKPFAVLGDFNRRLTPSDPLMAHLEAVAPVTLVTSGFASPCWGGESFIDHIILGNDAKNWLVPDSLLVMTYRKDTAPQGLSDHCPVSVKLALP